MSARASATQNLDDGSAEQSCSSRPRKLILSNLFASSGSRLARPVTFGFGRGFGCGGEHYRLCHRHLQERFGHPGRMVAIRRNTDADELMMLDERVTTAANDYWELWATHDAGADRVWDATNDGSIQIEEVA